MGGIVGAVLSIAKFALGGFTPMGLLMTAFSFAYSMYGAAQQKKAAKKAAKKARDAFNASLQDRTITHVANDAPQIYVYGRARVGSLVVAIFTSGAKDEYKHLVCVHAAHECDAIEEVYINGHAIGALDANGVNTTGPYAIKTTTRHVNQVGSGLSPMILNETANIGSVKVINGRLADFTALKAPKQQLLSYVLDGNTLTLDSPWAGEVTASYYTTTTAGQVRIKKHLGGASDPVDAALFAQFPGKWPATSVLRGYTYTVIRLDLNQAEFQGGIPDIQVLLRGKKLYDPRTETTAWSANPALVVYDYLTSPMCGVPTADLPVADYITAANVCDEAMDVPDSPPIPLYTCNGTVTADQDQAQILENLAQCMAGGIISTTWSVYAGKYIAPVLALDQSDIVGQIVITPGISDADIYNGVRGQYISAANSYVLTDFEPYQNANFVAADGAEKWTDIDFPFTDDKQRVHNLMRIFTEDQRSGYTIKADFSLKAWSLKVGQRVTFDSTFFGQTAKVFRVTDKSYSPTSAVELTLKEDAASIWDLADEVLPDATPNTDLPDPWVVAVPGNLTVTEALYETTGSAGVKTKAIVTWEAPGDITVIDYTLEYTLLVSDEWVVVPNINALFYEVLDIAPGLYDFRVRATNALFIASAYTEVVTKEIIGLAVAPADIDNFSISKVGGVAIGAWDITVDLDVRIGGRIIIRHSPLTSGATWSDGIILEEFNGDAVTGLLPLITGTYMVKARDSSGNYSTNAVNFVATEGMVSGFNTVGTITEHPAFTGTKTNLVITGSTLEFGPFGSPPAEELTGTYEFATVLDLSTVVTRRFEADISALSYDIGVTIDEMLDNIDTWSYIDGGIVDDCDVALYAATTDDDPSGSPAVAVYTDWTPFMVSDFTCRAAKFKLEFLRGSLSHNIAVSELVVHAKEPI